MVLPVSIQILLPISFSAHAQIYIVAIEASSGPVSDPRPSVLQQLIDRTTRIPLLYRTSISGYDGTQ